MQELIRVAHQDSWRMLFLPSHCMTIEIKTEYNMTFLLKNLDFLHFLIMSWGDNGKENFSVGKRPKLRPNVSNLPTAKLGIGGIN